MFESMLSSEIFSRLNNLPWICSPQSTINARSWLAEEVEPTAALLQTPALANLLTSVWVITKVRLATVPIQRPAAVAVIVV